ncbi:MAG: hypothetical protein R2795_04215 [Saprospiraceae bacterium]
MRRLMMVTLLLCGLLLPRLHCQVKYEREYRVAATDFPENAQQFIAGCETKGKVKWLKEEHSEGYSWEAKFRKAGKHYSVEFDSLGQLQDVETIVRQREIDTAVWDAIHRALEARLGTTKVIRLQEQWTGNAAMLQRAILAGTAQPGITTCFEVECTARDRKHFRAYEVLTDAKGAILLVRPIAAPNTQNLDY